MLQKFMEISLNSEQAEDTKNAERQKQQQLVFPKNR